MIVFFCILQSINNCKVLLTKHFSWVWYWFCLVTLISFMSGFGHPSSHPPSSHPLPHLGAFHYPHRAHTHQKSRAQFSRNQNPSYLHHVRSHLFSSQNSHGFSGAARSRGSISETTTLDVLFSFVLKSLKSFFKTHQGLPHPLPTALRTDM